MDLIARPLAPELVPALEDLFETGAAVGRCWCMYWRIGSAYCDLEPSANRESFRGRGHLRPTTRPARFRADLAVGWCQLTPREALPRLERSRSLARMDDVPVWSISCFYVCKGHRRRGVTEFLTGAALQNAKKAGAVAVEAYPLDGSVSSSSSFTGYLTTFEKVGFQEVARPSPSRPIVRYWF